MDWRATIVIVAAAVVSAAIMIIVNYVKLRSARKLADERLTAWQQAEQELKQITDQVSRLLYEIRVEELSDDEAIKQLHNVLAVWRPVDDPVPGVDDDGDGES